MRSPPGRVKGEAYVDQIVELGADRFAADLAPDVRKVLAILDKADSFEALEEALDKVFGRMNPKKAGRTLTRTIILAELAGRESIRLDLEAGD
jgi:phage gp29-like protein